MDGSALLQVTGGLAELLGLGTVALGISKTRASHTSRPNITRRAAAWAARSRIVRRFRKPKPQIVGVGTVEGGEAALRITGRMSIGDRQWAETDEEDKLELLLKQIRRDEQEIGELFQRMNRAEDEQADAERRRDQRQEELENRLRAKIDETAAGDLRLATAGALFFAAGVVLQIVGVIYS